MTMLPPVTKKPKTVTMAAEPLIRHVTAKQRRLRKMITIACLTPLASGISYITYVKWKLGQASHRAFTPSDMYYLRTMDGSVPQITENPGIRVEPSFLSESEQNQLRFDCKVLLAHYGYSVIPYYIKPHFDKQISKLRSSTKVNAFKASGKEINMDLNVNIGGDIDELKRQQESLVVKTNPWESNKPNAAPWGVGHSFDVKQLPQSFQNLVKKIQSLEGTII